MQEVDRQWRTATPRRHLSDERLTMVCYARPAIRMAAVLLVVFLVFGRSMGHFLDSAALFAAIAIAVGGAALAAAVAFTVFLSVRQRRAATGGCVSCQLRCQHAMTEQPRRLPLVSMVDRGAAAGAAGARRPALPVVAAGPAGSAGRAGGPGPRWPDRPAIHSGVPLRPAASRPAVSLPAASRPAVSRSPVSRPVVWRPVAVPYVPAPRQAERERARSAVLPLPLPDRRGQDAGREPLAAQPGEPRDGHGEQGQGPGRGEHRPGIAVQQAGHGAGQDRAGQRDALAAEPP